MDMGKKRAQGGIRRFDAPVVPEVLMMQKRIDFHRV